MAVRFFAGPAVMAAASIVVGLRGVLLHIAIVQVNLLQPMPFRTPHMTPNPAQCPPSHSVASVPRAPHDPAFSLSDYNSILSL